MEKDVATVALRVCIGFRVANFNEKPSGAAPDIIPLESNGGRVHESTNNSKARIPWKIYSGALPGCAPREALDLPRAQNVKGFQCFRASATMTTAETPRFARCCFSASFAPSLHARGIHGREWANERVAIYLHHHRA